MPPTRARVRQTRVHMPPTRARVRQTRARNRGREAGFWFRPPSLRTGQAVLPHPALQSVDSLQRLTRYLPGCGHREQPELREVPIGPANVGPTPSGAALSMASAQDASQSHPHPAVDGRKRRPVPVLEVLEPASQYRVEAGDDGFQAVAIVSLREVADLVLELHEALAARPLLVALEAVAEEVESSRLASAFHTSHLARRSRNQRGGSSFGASAEADADDQADAEFRCRCRCRLLIAATPMVDVGTTRVQPVTIVLVLVERPRPPSRPRASARARFSDTSC